MEKRKKKVKSELFIGLALAFRKRSKHPEIGIPTTMSPNILLRTYRLLVKKE